MEYCYCNKQQNNFEFYFTNNSIFCVPVQNKLPKALAEKGQFYRQALLLCSALIIILML